jgi:hypothetical protein
VPNAFSIIFYDEGERNFNNNLYSKKSIEAGRVLKNQENFKFNRKGKKEKNISIFLNSKSG